jgi:hypothetical protein
MRLLNQIILVIGFIIGSVNSLPIYQPYNHNIAKPSYKSPSVYIINNDIQPDIIRQPPSPPSLILYEPLELGPVIP